MEEEAPSVHTSEFLAEGGSIVFQVEAHAEENKNVRLLTSNQLLVLSYPLVRELHGRLLNLQASLPRMIQDHEERNGNAETRASLLKKICFSRIPHGSEQRSATLLFATKRIALTTDELMVFAVEVMMVEQDIRHELAEYFYATLFQVPSIHLMSKDAAHPRASVLCGMLPAMPLQETHPLRTFWLLLPERGDPTRKKDADHLCPTCLQHWRLLQQNGVTRASAKRLYIISGLTDTQKVFAWGSAQLRSVLHARTRTGDVFKIRRYEQGYTLGYGVYSRGRNGNFLVLHEKGACSGLMPILFPNNVRHILGL